MDVLSTTSPETPKTLAESLKAKHHLMETAFLVIQSFDEINEVTVDCVSLFTFNMLSKFFIDEHKVLVDVCTYDCMYICTCSASKNGVGPKVL